jgi:uroporphyrinogen decarboxylase
VTTDNSLELLATYLRPTPSPTGLTSREIVRKAIEFDNPPRIPYSFVDPLESDFFELAVLAGADGVARAAKGEMVFDEWGVGWRGSGRHWGHAEVSPLADLSALADYRFPQVLSDQTRGLLKGVAETAGKAGKYVVGADSINLFERLRSLMGFENLMIAAYTDSTRFQELLDHLTDMTVELVDRYADLGNVHAFMSWDDWGLQTTLQIRPAQWREVFKPRYERIVAACHRHGMHYVLHSCGFIWDIIPDFIDIGMDVIQIDQPRLMGVQRLADEFGGKICFWNCVDIQWSSQPEVTLDEVRVEAEETARRMARFGGGFIARQYPQPEDIEMPSEKHRAIYEGFMRGGCRRLPADQA